MGRADARVTIVEVSDFQCPFCARFALTALPAIRRRYPDDVAVVYRHWPLSIHPFAFDAAVASECAAAQGRFEPFHDALFRDQDSIGTRPFERFAVDAGVTDTAAFRLCRTSPQAAARVESDRRAALALGAGGTPSFVVNGYLLHAPLDSALLDSIVRAARPR
ncbi:MAG TPA: thioredoxin domain-containing protein [Gemmatimonadaceae bacterium]|nr:thioredoxin domain-containing protein [Gemmatimonadaceae bacterium]